MDFINCSRQEVLATCRRTHRSWSSDDEPWIPHISLLWSLSNDTRYIRLCMIDFDEELSVQFFTFISSSGTFFLTLRDPVTFPKLPAW